MPNVILKTENLTKCYGTLTAVNNLNLEVYQGEVLGFLGPNGAGKTTSINMMCGLLKPNHGQVWLHGIPLGGKQAMINRRIGMCPQNVVLWERLTCLEQLQFIGELYDISSRIVKKRAIELLELLGLLEKQNCQARTLSGGMQRRLNLAMALVHDPEIIVLDEPEAGLDPQSRVRLREFIHSLARKKTVILTTHNMDEAERVADRVAIIDSGELLLVDTPEALKRSVGEGDIVEIRLGIQKVDQAQVQAALPDIGVEIRMEESNPIVQVRVLHAVGKIADIIDKLTALGLQPGEVNLRPNSLEDVFIQLTGRRLRTGT
jgi:ABC-2 type transport system ATP-binding protein